MPRTSAARSAASRGATLSCRAARMRSRTGSLTCRRHAAPPFPGSNASSSTWRMPSPPRARMKRRSSKAAKLRAGRGGRRTPRTMHRCPYAGISTRPRRRTRRALQAAVPSSGANVSHADNASMFIHELNCEPRCWARSLIQPRTHTATPASGSAGAGSTRSSRPRHTAARIAGSHPSERATLHGRMGTHANKMPPTRNGPCREAAAA